MATAQLTDDELFSELKSFGFIPGPVSENTRPVYLKKLKKLREEQQQKGTRAGKNRNSGSIINNSSGGGNGSYTAAGASGFGARPASRDVKHLSPSSRSPGGRPVLNEKRTGGAGKFVLGFSSDESDVDDPKKKRGANHSGRRDRGSAYQQQQQIRPTTGAASATRKSLGVAVSTSSNNSSPTGLLEERRSGPGSLGWVDRGKSSLEVSRAAEVKGYDEEPEEEGDFQGETERDSRSLNGNRASYSLNTSSKVVGDYSDSEEEEEEEGGIIYGQDRQRDRRLQQHYSRRSHSSKPSPHRSARGSESGQETTLGMEIRQNDTPGASRSRLDMMGGREEDEEEEGKKRGPGESSLSGSLLRRHYPRGAIYVSAVTGESDRGSPGESSGNNSPSSAYNKNHIDSGDGATSSSSSRFSIGLRPRFSNYNSLSATYRPNHSNHSGPNHAYSQASLKQKYTVPEDELLQQFKREEVGSSTGGWGFSAHYLSMFLLMAACLFFLLLGLMYLRMRGSGASEVDVVIKNHPFGSEFDSSYNKTEKDTILKLLLNLHDHLAHIAGQHDCTDPEQQQANRSLSLKEASDYLAQQNEQYRDWVLLSLEWIIRTGEDVGIRLIGDNPEETVAEVSEVTRLESTHPKMSFSCRFRRAFFTVIHRVLLILSVIGLVWGVFYYMKYRWRREEEETRQMYDMVERIIGALRIHNASCQENNDLQPYLPIPHVRDSLVQPQDRKKLKKVWDRAVTFLSANESRIRTESQRIGGADFLVWRWLQPSLSCDQISLIPSKVWQGKAFPLDRRNSPPNSLTPCLKIRNMFDPVMEVGENWHLAIHEAILEKCCDNDGIVHIAVDKNSREGCVYVKCLSAEHSGKAFKALHGSWFDGKLVTVKYLRLDRYHQRFPQAQGCTTSLKPSNTYMNTMSRLRHHTSPDSSSNSNSLGFS
ncbi:inner nuclear membrane protein Man1-like [Salvelinus namaycush]|uniref:Inner nuclear membrane protein Man1 n=1 Tax=Salvelinus namaycush TaxID=8040 RepID=A0A8U0U496_SALNM|nr:inner nuclear membrane protein Man1-like [Salvelinus namaycush]